MCTSSHAHVQDLCSSTPENLLGFCTGVVSFQKCKPKPRHYFELAEEKCSYLKHRCKCKSSLFSVIFITHSTFPMPAFYDKLFTNLTAFCYRVHPAIEFFEPFLERANNDQTLAAHPYIDLNWPLSCATVGGDAKWLFAITESGGYFKLVSHWQHYYSGNKGATQPLPLRHFPGFTLFKLALPPVFFISTSSCGK